MSASEGSSTRPFTDLEQEHRKRFHGCDECKGVVAPLHEQPQIGTELARRAVTTPAELEVDELVEAFNRASVESLPDARLVIARPPLQNAGPFESAGIKLPHTVGGWDVIGVEQRITDVDFLISLPFYDPPQQNPSSRIIRNRLRCRICYHPKSDHCQLINEAYMDIYVTNLPLPGDVPQESRERLSYTDSHLLSPGIWRITAAGREDQHLVDFLLLQRQFVAYPISFSNKRPLDQVTSSDAKKRRGDVEMQFVLVPHAGAGKPSTEPAPAKSTPSPHAGITQSGQTTLLELSRGNSLVIQDLHSAKDAPENMNTSSYQVQYRWKIDETVGSKVFACHHSALPGDVVAKALDYTNKAAGGPSLYDCVRHWKEERDVLARLDHPNIIKIKSCDGRLLVIYLEHLPLSLHRQTPVAPTVALAILVDISSALIYLEEKDVVHNDVKPANIAYSPERGGVLFDFGMATTNARKQARGGTSLFLPPEYLHVQNEKRRGAPGDIWALGVTMLLSIGKIKYPKKSERVANLANLAVRGSDDFMRLEAWHAKIDLVRKLLSQQDDVEKMIYRMLDSNVTTRVTAAEIIAALGQQRRNLAERPSTG